MGVVEVSDLYPYTILGVSLAGQLAILVWLSRKQGCPWCFRTPYFVPCIRFSVEAPKYIAAVCAQHAAPLVAAFEASDVDPSDPTACQRWARDRGIWPARPGGPSLPVSAPESASEED